MRVSSAPFRGLARPIVDMLKPMSYPEIYPPGGGCHPTAVGRTMFLERRSARGRDYSRVPQAPQRHRCAWRSCVCWEGLWLA